MTPTNPQPEMTREAWLMAAAEELWPKVTAAGGTRPERFRVSCGWPSKSALRRASSASRRIGEAWHAGSEDGAREIFISPALAHPVEVMDVLLHELIHAALPGDAGHGPAFARIMKAVGLEGKPTSTFAGEALVEELKVIAERLGAYPHAKLDAEPKVKQKARLMKGECPDCGYVIRVTRTWIDVGMPTCPCGATMVSVEYEPEGEPLKLEEATVAYTTEDGRFRLSTTKRGNREGKWLVTDLESEELRFAIRHSRADALAFIAAVRAGETDFPEAEVEEPETDDVEELDVEDDFLADDEDEAPDYPEDQAADELGELLYEREAGRRERTWTEDDEAAFQARVAELDPTGELRREALGTSAV